MRTERDGANGSPSRSTTADGAASISKVNAGPLVQAATISEPARSKRNRYPPRGRSRRTNSAPASCATIVR